MEHGWVGLVVAVVRGDNVRSAQNNVALTVGAVARGIGGPKKSDGRGAQRNRKMKRSSIAADNAGRVVQESHQRPERPVVRHRVGIAAAFADGEREIVFARAVIDNTTE